MTLSIKEFNQQLCQFLDTSPTPYHAVARLAEYLLHNGFTHLYEKDVWDKLKAGKYFVTRNESSLVAFTINDSALSETGFNMVGAHTDSPCLKVKPQPEQINHGCMQLGVEVYGGALLNPWFDRDLSMAGRVSYEDDKQQIKQLLVDFKTAVAIIPSLAIHLDREANKNRSINAQLHLPAMIALMQGGSKLDFRVLLEQQLNRQYSELDIGKVLDFDISLYDSQPAAVTGLNGEFISSARLDNLLSCFIGLQALLQADPANKPALLVCHDHEEVGSQSRAGADGTFLKSVLQRLSPQAESFQRMMERSMLISADNAHALHPNYADKHDCEHGPSLNKGPVIKSNANQRYATSSETSAVFRQLCAKVNVPVQDFVVRTDMACGSTIGPISASNIGVRTLDVGLPTLAMHSIRELAGSEDSCMLYRVFCAFFNQAVEG